MIVIIEVKSMKLTHYRTLKAACRVEKWMNYNTLKNKRVDVKGILYKGMWIYRIFHS